MCILYPIRTPPKTRTIRQRRQQLRQPRPHITEHAKQRSQRTSARAMLDTRCWRNRRFLVTNVRQTRVQSKDQFLGKKAYLYVPKKLRTIGWRDRILDIIEVWLEHLEAAPTISTEGWPAARIKDQRRKVSWSSKPRRRTVLILSYRLQASWRLLAIFYELYLIFMSSLSNHLYLRDRSTFKGFCFIWNLWKLYAFNIFLKKIIKYS